MWYELLIQYLAIGMLCIACLALAGYILYMFGLLVWDLWIRVAESINNKSRN